MSPILTQMRLPPATLGEFAGDISGRTPSGDRIDQVAADFEGLFASQILKQMRQTLDGESLFGGDSSDVYGGLFDLYLGQQMAQSGGFGLANMLRESLQRSQHADKAPTAIQGR